ncbi:hypothetical protein [Bauldia litoralis]|uniref:7-cyano-7-deazaguanine synthase (Queuosine biosynthesis) n=1 Tax=Bauldia litoralis TaxID=665467 RepID=A0A1G6EMU3_9HYPH|nr:hypothetical protein [Bauldia litoralis]SDB58592.1 hypothetical protein SAMN02982931_04704 [Bauldia litoralis]
MRETSTFRCGRSGGSDNRPGTRYLDVDGPEGSDDRVNLKIDHISRKMVATIPDRFVDLLEIAAYVYAADQLVSRGGRAMRGMGREWRRDLVFEIPVRDVGFWQGKAVIEKLVSTLTFLSDDNYRFRFVEARSPRAADERFDFTFEDAPSGFHPDDVILFSGGLDSLAGAASCLRSGRKVALVSHCASTHVQARQRELVEELRRRSAPGSVFHVPVRITRGLDEPSSFTQRTRSFLFACLAAVVAGLFRKSQFDFFENGVVSVNLPIAGHVLGSRATRTTHPKVLSDFAALFGLVTGGDFTVGNPFFWDTKTEVLGRLRDAGHADLIGRSFSCSHVRLAASSGQQCGICTQCLDRRFAILAAGLEKDDPHEGYRVDLFTGGRDDPMHTALAESYVLSAARYAKMTETAFYTRNGNALRVLSHLPGDMNANAVRLYALHQRHGEAVCRVTNVALREHATVGSASSLPRTCLLALLRSPTGLIVEKLRDPTEHEAPIAEQATLRNIPVLPRPIVVTFHHAARFATIAGAVEIGGVGYSLLAALADLRLREMSERCSRSGYGFLSPEKLARTQAITEAALRQQVSRVRQQLQEKFERAFEITPDKDEIIESKGWSGYRLNPHLLLDSVEETAVASASRGDVTTLSPTSQNPLRNGKKSPLPSG